MKENREEDLMKLLRIVLKDIKARKKRVLFAILGVVIGTMTITAILTISMAARAQVYSQLEKFGPNLTIVPAINTLDMKLGSVNLGQLSVGDNYIPEDRLPEIRRIADTEIKKALEIEDEGEIAVMAPKLYVNTEIKGMSLTVVGVQPASEMAIRTWWMVQRGAYIGDGRSDQAIIGAVAAEILKINPGDKIALNGSELTVTGILEETGSDDDYQIFADLKTVQSAFGKQGMLSVVDVRALCNGCPVEVIADAINGQISGVRAVAVKQIAESEMGMIDKVNRFMMTLGAITLLIGLFGVVNTMVASVNERIKDIGIMRAVGASRGQIILTFIYEAILIGVIGGIFGYLAGSGLAYVVGPMIFEGAAISFVPAYFPLSVGLAIIIAVLAAIWPAQRASHVKVADCFRSL
jgi:putative ABC transport system permease protein